MIDKPLRKEEGMHLSREQIDEIFDVEELNPGIAGVGLCHSEEHPDECEGCCFSEDENAGLQIYHDKKGQHYMVAGGKRVGISLGYPLKGRYVRLPVPKAAALDFAITDDPLTKAAQTAMKEFDALEKSEDCYEVIWRYEEGLDNIQKDEKSIMGFGYDVCFEGGICFGTNSRAGIREKLLKMNADTYILLSTSFDYPFAFRDMQWLENGGFIPDTIAYIYFITPQAARRWSIARGMDEETCLALFGSTAS